MLTPSNPDAEHAVMGVIMAPEGEAKLALNPGQAQQFLEILYAPYFSRGGQAFLEVRGKREGEGMTFRRFYSTPALLLADMNTWDPTLNYWVGVALRRDSQGGTKKDLIVLTAAFGDVDCGTAGHKGATKYQNKAEALTAIESFPLRPSILIESGGGYQPYWLLQEPVELSNGNLALLERINRGLALALGGDVAATDASRILRLPGTYNMKLDGNPRPVKIVWCEPGLVYGLAELSQYEENPQGQRHAPHGEAAARPHEKGEYAAYAQAAFERELADLARAGEGERNNRLNQAAFALGQLVGAGVLDRSSVEAALFGVAVSIGLTGSEVKSTICSGLDSGVREPRRLPEKKAKTKKRKKDKVPDLIKSLDIASTYLRETGLELLTDPPQVESEGFTPCTVLYNPEDPGRTAFINIGQGEKRGYYVELKDGIPILGGTLCKTIGEKGTGPYMTPKDVYAYLLKSSKETPGRDPAKAPPDEPKKSDAILNEVGQKYAISNDRHCLVLNLEDGVEYKPLCNFTARISDEINRDDGLRVIKEFVVSGNVGGHQLPPAKVATKEFDSMSWVRREWGAAPSITPVRNNAVHLPNAILAHSRTQGINRQTIYTHTGWRKINGVWRYLHGDGAIGPGKPVTVDLGENLHPYRLPKPGGIEAAQANLRFLGIGPWEITAPLWSGAYLATYADLCKIDFSMWLHGPTGSLKSTLLALIMGHFGTFTRQNLPGSWFSTANSLEKLTFILKDTICPIDDFCPPANQKESHAMAERAGRIIYQAGNRSARGRLGPDLMARPNYYPRSLIISTGEMLLPGQRQSATARYLPIELDPKKIQIDKVRLTAAQKERHLYAAAMAGYLEAIAPDLDEHLAMVRELWEGYRTAFQNASQHLRIPEILSWLATGFDLGLRFQVSMGTITQDESDEMLYRAWQVFTGLGERHSQTILGDRPTLKFISVLRELFRQGRIYAEGANTDGAPCHGKDLGWDGIQPTRNAEFVGWANEDTIFLMPETALRVVHEAIRRQGDFLALGRNDMFAALARDGFIVPGKDGNTHVKKIQGSSKRVIFLPFKKLIHDEVEDEYL